MHGTQNTTVTDAFRVRAQSLSCTHTRTTSAKPWSEATSRVNQLSLWRVQSLYRTLSLALSLALSRSLSLSLFNIPTHPHTPIQEMSRMYNYPKVSMVQLEKPFVFVLGETFR